MKTMNSIKTTVVCGILGVLRFFFFFFFEYKEWISFWFKKRKKTTKDIKSRNSIKNKCYKIYLEWRPFSSKGHGKCEKTETFFFENFELMTKKL